MYTVQPVLPSRAPRFLPLLFSNLQDIRRRQGARGLFFDEQVLLHGRSDQARLMHVHHFQQ